MAARARRKGVSVVMQFTKQEVINQEGLICYLCGKSLTNETATIDHVIPLAKGGFHCLSNAKIACLPCNQKKGNKDLNSYLEGAK